MTPRPPHAAGFTLIELLIAATITVLVTAAAVTVLSGVSAARDRLRRQLDLQQQAHVAAHTLAAALRNAYRPGRRRERLLIGEDALVGDLPRDRVRFDTVSDRPVRRDQPESDVREAEFFIAGPNDPAGGSAPALMRRLDPTSNPQPDEGGVVERVATNVVGLDVTYYDGVEWLDEWEARPASWTTSVNSPAAQSQATQPLGEGWPEAIRVRVIVNDDPTDPGARSQSATALINFPKLSRANRGGSVQPEEQVPESTADQEGRQGNQGGQP